MQKLRKCIEWMARIGLIVVGGMCLSVALRKDHSIPYVMWKYLRELIYLRAYVLDVLFWGYLAAVSFWTALCYKNIWKGLLGCWWQMTVLILGLFPVLTYGCEFQKMTVRDEWVLFVQMLPFTIWSICGLYQLVRKVKFTVWTWMVHLTMFALWFVWALYTNGINKFDPIVPFIEKLGKTWGLY